MPSLVPYVSESRYAGFGKRPGQLGYRQLSLKVWRVYFCDEVRDMSSREGVKARLADTRMDRWASELRRNSTARDEVVQFAFHGDFRGGEEGGRLIYPLPAWCESTFTCPSLLS